MKKYRGLRILSILAAALLLYVLAIASEDYFQLPGACSFTALQVEAKSGTSQPTKIDETDFLEVRVDDSLGVLNKWFSSDPKPGKVYALKISSVTHVRKATRVRMNFIEVKP